MDEGTPGRLITVRSADTADDPNDPRTEDMNDSDAASPAPA